MEEVKEKSEEAGEKNGKGLFPCSSPPHLLLTWDSDGDKEIQPAVERVTESDKHVKVKRIGRSRSRNRSRDRSRSKDRSKIRSQQEFGRNRDSLELVSETVVAHLECPDFEKRTLDLRCADATTLWAVDNCKRNPLCKTDEDEKKWEKAVKKTEDEAKKRPSTTEACSGQEGIMERENTAEEASEEALAVEGTAVVVEATEMLVEATEPAVAMAVAVPTAAATVATAVATTMVAATVAGITPCMAGGKVGACGQPTNQPFNQPTNQPTDQPTNRSTNQPINQATE